MNAFPFTRAREKGKDRALARSMAAEIESIPEMEGIERTHIFSQSAKCFAHYASVWRLQRTHEKFQVVFGIQTGQRAQSRSLNAWRIF